MVPSRRDVIRHTVSSGFALAVTPIAGTVLATDAQGLEAGDVKIPSPAECEFHVYPEAGHAFAADYRPSYRKPDAEDGFSRLHAWFKAHGVG